MKFKSANIPNEEDKEFDINEFNRQIVFPDLAKYPINTVKILVQIRISELEYQLDQLNINESIDMLSEEEYHIKTLAFDNEMKETPLESNGYNDLILDWISKEKTRCIDELIVLNPENNKTKKIARAAYSIQNNLHLINFSYLSDDINILRDSLRDNKFIEPGVRLNQFFRIFSDKEIDKPIKWLGTQAELSYLVKTIKPWLFTQRAYLKRTANIFVDANGEPFISDNIGSPNSDIRFEREKILHNMITMFIQGLEEARRKKPLKH
jgi:hypothetical protein